MQDSQKLLTHQAPLFVLPDQDGTLHQLSDYQGKWVLLYFYPKDDTPGCTTQACGLRDAWQDFQDRDVVVFGISKDSISSHKKFAQKYHLPFRLLADTDGRVAQEYGVLREKKMFGKAFTGIARTSFLIDPNGIIAHIYPKVRPASHAQTILSDIPSHN